MAWNAPVTQSVGTLITPAIWNSQIVENLLYLKSPPITLMGSLQTLTTSSSSYVNVFETQNIVTAAGGRVLLMGLGYANHNESGVVELHLNLTVDGVDDVAGSDGYVRQYLQGTGREPFVMLYMSDTLSPAMHTFRLRAKVIPIAGTTGTVTITTRRFWLMEV